MGAARQRRSDASHRLGQRQDDDRAGRRAEDRRRQQGDRRGLPEARQGSRVRGAEGLQGPFGPRAPVRVQYRLAGLFPAQPREYAERARSFRSADVRDAAQYVERRVHADFPDPDLFRDLVVPVARHVARRGRRFGQRHIQRGQSQGPDVRQGLERDDHVQGRGRTGGGQGRDHGDRRFSEESRQVPRSGRQDS